MADIPISLFFKGNRTYGVGNIKFDLLYTESHNFDSAVSVHPVEDGSQISDHIQNAMESGSITGLISNYSINADVITSNRAQDVFNALVSLWNERTLVTITSILKVYDNVAITSMPIIRDASSGESIIIQLSFQQVKVVKLQELELVLSVKVNDLDSDINQQTVDVIDAGRTVPELSELAVV